MNEKWHVQFRPEAREELRAIPKQMAMRILSKLSDLETNPYGFGSTALVSDPTRRRLRVGDFRVVYTLDHGHLIIWIVSTVYNHL